MNPSKYAWRVVVSMRISKDSSRFFTVEAMALQNLPQTLRGRERSKRGYASPLLRAGVNITCQGCRQRVCARPSAISRAACFEVRVAARSRLTSRTPAEDLELRCIWIAERPCHGRPRPPLKAPIGWAHSHTSPECARHLCHDTAWSMDCARTRGRPIAHAMDCFLTLV